MLRFLILGYFLRNIYNWRKTHQGNQSQLQNFWLEQSPSCLSFGAPIAIFLLSGGIFLFCLDSLSLSCRQQKSCYSGPVSYCVFLLGNNVGVCSMLCGGAVLLRPDVNIARSCSCSSSKIGQSCSPSWPPLSSVQVASNCLWTSCLSPTACGGGRVVSIKVARVAGRKGIGASTATSWPAIEPNSPLAKMLLSTYNFVTVLQGSSSIDHRVDQFFPKDLWSNFCEIEN